MTLEDIFEQYKDEIYLSLFKILNYSSASLLDPCYNPPISSMFKREFNTSLYKTISKTGFNIEKYIEDNYIRKVQSFKLFKDKTVWFLLLASIYFNGKKKKDNIDNEIIFLSTFNLLLKYYTSLSVKHMSKFCDKTKAILALNTLSEKSLFSAKNKTVIQLASATVNRYSLNTKIKHSIKNSNIALGIVYILDAVMNKYYPKVKNIKDISKLIIIFRHRLSQSFKAYARHYYDLMNAKIEDKQDMGLIENSIHQVVNSNAQRLVYISDNHYYMVSKMTEIPISVLKKMYEVTYRSSELYDTVSNIINILFHDDRFSYLQNTNTVYEWLVMVRSVVSLRSRYDIRSMLMQIIEYDEELKGIYQEGSDSYKHKMIQALGGVIALSIYDSIRVRGLSHFANYNMIV